MVTAIILSGGKGKRMGEDISKQYIEINEKPTLYYTLKKFINNKFVDKIVLVLPQDEIDYCTENVINKYNLNVDTIVCGGKERQDSAMNGLIAAEGSDIVLIHDGARPFVDDRIIEDGIVYAKNFIAAAPGVMPKDTIKIKSEDGFSECTLNRENLVAIQTPQCFVYEEILKAHKYIKEKGINVTDDTKVIEEIGHKVYLYEGSYTNIKITTKEDLILGEFLSRV